MKFKELLKILLCIALIYFAYEYTQYAHSLRAYTFIEVNEYHLVLGFSKKVLAMILLLAAGGIASSSYNKLEFDGSHSTSIYWVLQFSKHVLFGFLIPFLIVTLGFWNLVLWPAVHFFLFADVSQLFEVMVELFNFNQHPTGNDKSTLETYFSILELLLSALVIVVGVFFNKFRKNSLF